MLTRRAFLASVAAVPLAPGLARSGSVRTLSAAPAELQLAPDGYGKTPLWCFDGQVPGPLLRVPRGGLLRINFRNDLPQPSAIHWHGIRIENAMDGVPGLTQAAVAPGTGFDYDFALPDAGTYWYHSHNRSWEQVARGLHGPLIVDEATPPEVDDDLVLVLDDWRLDNEARLAEDFASMRDLSHAGRIGNWITVNAEGEPAFPTRRNARLRLRLINAANARIFTVSGQGLAGWVVALDGQPLAQPQPWERLTLAPAQRADLIVDVVTATPDGATLVSHERDGDYAVSAFPVTDSAREERLPAPPALEPNDLPQPDRKGALSAEFVMQGGAMGRMESAEFEGQTLGIRELVRNGQAWALNGVAGMPEQPLFDVVRGQTVLLTLVNDTAWPHGIHTHGHHFREINEDGAPGPWRDTLLVQRNQRRKIEMVADNPGDWLIHCHMLEHAAAGMTSWFRVT